MRAETNDFFKETALGLALVALAFVSTQIDAKSMLRFQASAILSPEKQAPFCKLAEINKISSDQMCKANFKKEVANGTGNQFERK